MFALYRTCAHNHNQKSRDCFDKQRCMNGTWCTPEIQKAVELGYNILKIYHLRETTQSDSATGESGLFGDYVNLFLKLKQEASSPPPGMKTEEDLDKYIADFKKQFL